MILYKMFISGQSEKKGGERGSDRSGKEKFYEENKGETHGYNLETKMDILAAAGSDCCFYRERHLQQKKKAEKQRIHTFIIRLLMQRRALRSVI